MEIENKMIYPLFTESSPTSLDYWCVCVCVCLCVCVYYSTIFWGQICTQKWPKPDKISKNL